MSSWLSRWVGCGRGDGEGCWRPSCSPAWTISGCGGSRWATALENRHSDVRRVAELADARGRGAGAIPARVAESVLQSAQFAKSEFVAEYLSGILASSRTPDGHDDRGISWTRLISQLSSDQVRMHYVLYTAARLAIAENITGNRLGYVSCNDTPFL